MMQMHVPFVSRLTLSPEDRTVGLVVCSVATAILLAGVLGVLLAHHVSPCNPRNLGRCGRRLVGTLQGLDRSRAPPLGQGPGGEAAAVCPSLVEALDCFYWFSQRCLPVREQHFYAKLYMEGSRLAEGLCRPGLDRGGVDGVAGTAPEPLLVTHEECLRGARVRRAECSELFFGHLNDDSDAQPDDAQHRVSTALIDSLYDPDAVGTFQAPLCRAIRDFIMCGLHLVNDNCGLDVALELQNLHDNLTNLVFTKKCSSSLRPLLQRSITSELVVDLSPASPGLFNLIVTLLLVLVLLVVLFKSLKEFCKRVWEYI